MLIDLKLFTSLFKKDLTDTDDSNFVELGTVINGVLRQKNSSDYSIITDELSQKNICRIW